MVVPLEWYSLSVLCRKDTSGYASPGGPNNSARAPVLRCKMKTSLRIAILAAVLAASVTARPSPLPPEMRVALVGDSLVHGAGDESGKGLAGRLERELRSRGFGSIVTTNLGVTGATTDDLGAALRLPKTRAAVRRAHAVVVSVGANDLRATLFGDEPVRSPLVIADQVLRNIDGIVDEIRALNPGTRILVLGAYAPVPREGAAALLEPLVAIWDAALMAQFADDPLVSVVQLSDIIDRPARLSRRDGFHPGGEAYQVIAGRIADNLTGN